MPVGGTWLIPAAIAGAGVTSAAVGAGAAKSAAQTQAAAANQATQAQLDIYGQNKAALAPFIAQGSNAGSALQKLLGLSSGTSSGGTPGAQDWMTYLQQNPDAMANFQQLQASGRTDPLATDPIAFAQYHWASDGSRRPVPTFAAASPSTSSNDIQTQLENLPGYQFTKNQGVQTVNRQLGSLGLTGAQAKGISRFVTGLADSTYNSQVANLQNATNTGEGAAAAQAGVGANTGSGISNTIVGAGTAGAAGTVGAANAITGGLSSIPGALLTNSILNGGKTGSGGGSGIYGTGVGNTDANFGG